MAATAMSSASFYYNYDTTTSAGGGKATLSFSTSGSQMIVGDQGTASFTQGGGDLNLAAQHVTLDIGQNAGSHGAYYPVGGTLEDDLVVGDAGGGLFSNTGGTHTVNGNLVVGNQLTGVGIYTLGGTGNLALTTAGAQVILGNASGANGTFNFNTTSGDTGTVTFNSGTGQQIIVGENGSGTVNQGGGNLNLSGKSVSLTLGANANSSGVYNLNGGSLETQALNVGDAGFGQFNQSGGAAAVSGALTIGNQGTGIGQLNLSGGTTTVTGNLLVANDAGSEGVVSLNANGANTPNLTVEGNAVIGVSSYGSFDENAGSADIQGTMTFAVSSSGGGVAIEGGTLTVGNGGPNNALQINSNGTMKTKIPTASAPQSLWTAR